MSRASPFCSRRTRSTASSAPARCLPPERCRSPTTRAQSTELDTRNIIIATGSDVAGIPGVPVEIDETVIVSSTGAIALDKVPERLVVVGGGVIGLELGSVWNRLGAKVTVIEYLDTILGGMDAEISRQFARILAKQGIELKLSAKVTAVTRPRPAPASPSNRSRAARQPSFEADVVLIATGRKPYTTASAWPRQASCSTGAAGWRSTAISEPRCPASMRSVTWCAARCWPTRPRTRASLWPRSSPASTAM